MSAGYLALVTRTLTLTPPLTVRQLAVLLYLGQGGALTYTDVCDALPMRKPALTRSADALERAGLLARAPSKDRRVPVLLLTPKGAKLASDLIAGDRN